MFTCSEIRCNQVGEYLSTLPQMQRRPASLPWTFGRLYPSQLLCSGRLALLICMMVAVGRCAKHRWRWHKRVAQEAADPRAPVLGLQGSQVSHLPGPRAEASTAFFAVDIILDMNSVDMAWTWDASAVRVLSCPGAGGGSPPGGARAPWGCTPCW